MNTGVVCVQCQVEYVPDKNEVIAIQNASFGPYKVYMADQLRCPKCGHKVLAGFGREPIREDHYVPSFKPWLESVIARAKVVVHFFPEGKS